MFDDLKDSDREKWEDFVCDLKWRKDQIHNMLAHRICNSGDEVIENKGFKASWNKVFLNKPVKISNTKHGTTNHIGTFDYICKRSFFRPRDFIRYLQIVSKVTDEYGQDISRVAPQTLVESEALYSKRFRREVADELHSALPGIDHYLDSLGKIKYIRYFSYEDINNAFIKDGGFNRDRHESIGLKNILKYLFHYSIVGNIDRRYNMETKRTFNYRTLKYNFSTSSIDYQENFTLHSALFRSVFESKSRNSLAFADSENTVDLYNE